MKIEGNIMSDWIEIHGDPKIKIQVLNEAIDKLIYDNKLLKQELAYEKRKNLIIVKP